MHVIPPVQHSQSREPGFESSCGCLNGIPSLLVNRLSKRTRGACYPTSSTLSIKGARLRILLWLSQWHPQRVGKPAVQTYPWSMLSHQFNTLNQGSTASTPLATVSKLGQFRSLDDIQFTLLYTRTPAYGQWWRYMYE